MNICFPSEDTHSYVPYYKCCNRKKGRLSLKWAHNPEKKVKGGFLEDMSGLKTGNRGGFLESRGRGLRCDGFSTRGGTKDVFMLRLWQGAEKWKKTGGCSNTRSKWPESITYLLQKSPFSGFFHSKLPGTPDCATVCSHCSEKTPDIQYHRLL